jgi:hypothetical protein
VTLATADQPTVPVSARPSSSGAPSFILAFIGVFAGSVVVVVAQVELQGLEAGLKLVRSFPGKPRPFERARGSGTWPWRVATALPAT